MAHYVKNWDETKYALFSDDWKHRYLLGRRFQGGDSAPVLWCMLNPSKADASIDDATIRRVRGFSEDWGFKRFEVVNLYSLVETNAQDMLRVDFGQRIGPSNTMIQVQALQSAALVVVAWGANMEGEDAHWRAFIDLVHDYKHKPFCLGRTAAGHPKHPLRLARNTPLEPFE
jgi:hypothetical protein